jgi:heme exporter protein D
MSGAIIGLILVVLLAVICRSLSTRNYWLNEIGRSLNRGLEERDHQEQQFISTVDDALRRLVRPERAS